MAKRTAFFLLAIMIILPSWSMAADGIMERIEFNANAGLSIPLGDASDRFNIGICFGLDGFVPYKDNILFGGRLAYNRWGIDAGGWGADDNDGSGSVMEFIPQVRYLFSRTDSTSSTYSYYCQAGLGLYRFAYDVNVKNIHGIIKNPNDSDLNLGLSLGGGIIIYQSESRSWEIRPTLNIIFNNDSTKYFTITGGLSI